MSYAMNFSDKQSVFGKHLILLHIRLTRAILIRGKRLIVPVKTGQVLKPLRIYIQKHLDCELKFDSHLLLEPIILNVDATPT